MFKWESCIVFDVERHRSVGGVEAPVSYSSWSATFAGLFFVELRLGYTRVVMSAPFVPFSSSTRSPDPKIEILDDSFRQYRLYSSPVEQLASGMYWAEGPVYFPASRYLLVSDVPSNRIMRYDEVTGHWGEFRSPSNHSNGLARDPQGRLVACEHLTRRVTRTEHDGSITVLADHYRGKLLNSPNDVACHPNGTVWFTDPVFGISSDWEGDKALAELRQSVYCITPEGELISVEVELKGPNGLAFTPDYRQLYVVESRAEPSRVVWRYDLSENGRELESKTKLIDADGAGALDGICVDEHGNIWCGWGSDGRDGASSEQLDGVKVFNNVGNPIGFIRLPERCANLTFGGPKRNRLFMASSHSLYAVYVGVRGIF